MTRNERDVVRGRANSLRLAITGQLGPDALSSDAMAETMKLCVSCKGCKRECPTGVDMARMKIEVLSARAKKHGLSIHDRLVGYMPRYAPWASKMPFLMNLRDKVPGLAKATERLTGFTARRPLPNWDAKPFKDTEVSATSTPDVVLFADSFNRYFEPENLRAAVRVLNATGSSVDVVKPAGNGRPLCCGRTFLSVGLVDQARQEAKRLVDALMPYAERDVPIIGLEPSCLLTLRDEIPVLLPGEDSARIAKLALMFEEFIADQRDNPQFTSNLHSPAPEVTLHGHCHQKAMGSMPSIERTLALLPNTNVTRIESSCCGMAGAFGYGADTYDTSIKMAELDVLPAARAAPGDAIIVADGTSCRHQIADNTDRNPMHIARLLDLALKRV